MYANYGGFVISGEPIGTGLPAGDGDFHAFFRVVTDDGGVVSRVYVDHFIITTHE
jgi:hypothetical protein